MNIKKHIIITMSDGAVERVETADPSLKNVEIVFLESDWPRQKVFYVNSDLFVYSTDCVDLVSRDEEVRMIACASKAADMRAADMDEDGDPVYVRVSDEDLKAARESLR